MLPANRPAESSRDVSVWPHRIAVITACATFLLLFIGGLVTSKGAGLAVPDWPTTFGYNMFLYPWSRMIGHVFYEHSHRLVASAVGLLTIALAVTLWLREERLWVRNLGLLALALVIFQGVLGGLRVLLLEQTLAIVHAAVAQAFFALVVTLALVTSLEWRQNPPERSLTDGNRLRRLGTLTTGFIYVQIFFGAVLRHTGSRLDAHLLFAALVAVHVVLLALRVTKRHHSETKLIRPAQILIVLLLVQLVLGAVSYFGKFTGMLRMPAEAVVFFTTTHLITGALMFVICLVLTLRAYRFPSASIAAAAHQSLKERYSV
jgi:cytochrome c oxidase assembly protein subunit 15